MKTTIVPAQITTLEDKIAGSLSVIQLVMLTTPIFINSALYVLLPPFMRFELYKIVLGAVIFLLFAVLAIRIKGRLISQWLLVILRYNIRPRYFVFNKNDFYLRGDTTSMPEAVSNKPDQTTEELVSTIPSLAIAELVNLESAVSDPLSAFEFSTDKKGGLRVHIVKTD